MSVFTAILIMGLTTMLAVIFWQGNLIYNLLRNRDVNHAKCIAHVSHYTGNQFAAQVLLAAAEDYTSPEGQHEVAVIAHRNQSSVEPIPSLWMRARAVEFQKVVDL